MEAITLSNRRLMANTRIQYASSSRSLLRGESEEGRREVRRERQSEGQNAASGKRRAELPGRRGVKVTRGMAGSVLAEWADVNQMNEGKGQEYKKERT